MVKEESSLHVNVNKPVFFTATTSFLVCAVLCRESGPPDDYFILGAIDYTNQSDQMLYGRNNWLIFNES